MLHVKVMSVAEEKLHAVGAAVFTNQERGIWIWDVLNFASVFVTTGNRMYETD